MRDFHLPGRSAVFAENGMCATSHPLGAKTAVDILERGGNAVDAAIGAAVLLGFCEPQMTGLGGDCFALIKPAGSNEVMGINGSGRAPAGLRAADLRAQGHAKIDTQSVASVTIPGAVDAFCQMSDDFGQIGLAETLTPAIRYAEDGIPVAPRTAFDWSVAADRLQGRARDYYLVNGSVPLPGQVFRAPGQAEVLRRIASEGRDGFYTGEVADDMVAALRAAGGVHTLEDFSAERCERTVPIVGSYAGHEILEHPPNGHGATALLILNILKSFDLKALDPFGPERAHLEAEATKLAYDTRNRLIADADYTTRLAHMLAPETAEKLAALINPGAAMANPTALSEEVHRETIYLTVVDRDRTVVSLIYSIFATFGAGLASDKFGILFHNRGSGFTLEEGHPNEAHGGKRPMHTIIPGMVRRDGEVVMPFGVMGGPYQAAGHARVLTNILDYDLHPQAALDAPRTFATDGGLQVERGYSDEARQALSDLGHDVIVPETAIGGAQAILIDPDTGVLQGASDPRKDGCALGY